MAITITDEYLDNGSSVGCKLTTPIEMSKRDSAGGGGGHDSSSTSETASDEISFHKHCQKTVCSAYGYNGRGATWNLLYRGEGDLANI